MLLFGMCSTRPFIHMFYHLCCFVSWAQEDVGVPLGILTEGSIEKCNQEVKETNSRFVARVSRENIHINTLTRRSWAVDPLLHHEATVKQVDYLDIPTVSC